MAATITPAAGAAGVETPAGSYRRAFFTITPDASYPTGGYPLTPGQFGLVSIIAVDANPSQGAGHPVVYNVSTGKLQYFTSGGTEVANATNLSTYPVVAEVIGF